MARKKEADTTHDESTDSDRPRKWADRFPEQKFKPRMVEFGDPIIGNDNGVHKFKSEYFRNADGTQGSFFIRFEKNPNEGRDKDDPHPVLKLLKEELGVKYIQAPDGHYAWSLPFAHGQWSRRQEMDVAEIAKQCADMLGCQDQGLSR